MPTKIKAPITTLTEQIEMLRVQLETALPLPTVLLLSSARADDGTSAVALGLASSMEQAGYSTLLVLADQRSPDADSGREPKSLDEIVSHGLESYIARGTRTGPRSMVLPSEKIRHTVSQRGVGRFAELCRADFQVTIVEAGSVLTNTFAMLAAVAANGVLLTVREGRRVCKEDRLVAEALDREDVSFLGVVSVAEAIIRDMPAVSVQRAAVRRPRVQTVSGETDPNRAEQPV